MIRPSRLLDALAARGVGFFAGVPDSLLASFCAYLEDHCRPGQHVIAANEGNAVALGVGYHLATGQLAAIYMQNSGLGNAVNPLVSLADPKVYRIPMVLIIGWRGEPGVPDEPQHVQQGQVTLEQLAVLGVPYWVVDAGSNIDQVVDAAMEAMTTRTAPVALVVRKGALDEYTSAQQRDETSELSREDALDALLGLCGPNELIVATTGKTSREVYELRSKRGQPHTDFLTVGGMGHTSSIALGVALGRPDRRIVCLDGDGSLIMHMGSLPVIAKARPFHFMHVLLNNEAHESVGGQATAAGRMDFQSLSRGVGYAGYAKAHDVASLVDGWQSFSQTIGPVLLEVRIRCGSRSNLGRPTTTAEANKFAFMEMAREHQRT